ncbi:hypothetical protein KKC06_06755, partial [Patescibacteria group bacterium]|nr:hypothetical protein [Patescibacteria group bacterium]
AGRIMFPYWKSGKVVYFIGRKTEWTPDKKFDQGKYKKLQVKKDSKPYISDIISNKYFYGEDSLRGADYCIITEGVTDCIMALQSGIPCISPVTTRFRADDYDKILSLVSKLKQVIICNDNEDNDSGKKGAMDTAEYLEHNGVNVKLIELPKPDNIDKIDLAEYLKIHQVEDFNVLINTAVPIVRVKLNGLPVSDDPLNNVITATDFVKTGLNGQLMPYKVAFVETHIKNHFGFSSKIISEIISEMKSNVKEKKQQDKMDFQDTILTDPQEIIPDDIIEAARQIIFTGDPVGEILKVHSSLHVGDEPLAKALLVSIGIQSVKNSDGIHPKVSGDSGKGKTHCCKAMMHLLPKKYKFSTTLSDKAIYYMDIPEGAVIFSDDVDLSDGLQGIIKRATSNFQDGDTYTTIDINRAKQELTIPPRVAWWLTSVDDDQSLQLLNRQFGGGVDESDIQDRAVYEFQKKLLLSGEVGLPESREVKICRCIVEDIKHQLYTVIVPFADDMDWVDINNRRNFLIFADIIKAFAALRHRQRYHTENNEIIANIDDFNDAKELYIGRARNQGTKLTDAELKFCNLLNGAGELDYNVLQKSMNVSQGRISQIIHGKGKGDSGLINKVRGLIVEKRSVKTDDDTTVYKNVCSLHNFNPFDHYKTIITLKEGAEERFISHYPPITRILPEKNALPSYYITYITYYNNNISNKLIEKVTVTDSDEIKYPSLKTEKQGNKVITPQPIMKEQGNIDNKQGGILPKLPHNAQLQLTSDLVKFKKAHYSMTKFVDVDQFTLGFCDAHEQVWKPHASHVKEEVKRLNEIKWFLKAEDTQEVSSQQSTAKTIRNIIINRKINGLTKIDDLITQAGSVGISEDDTMEYIKQLKLDGSIFEPKNGYYGCV